MVEVGGFHDLKLSEVDLLEEYSRDESTKKERKVQLILFVLLPGYGTFVSLFR